MNQMSGSARIVFAQAIFVALLAVAAKAAPAEVIKASGHGEVPVATLKKQKDQAAANQKALADAENLARQMAVRQAILQVFPNQDGVQSKVDAVLKTALDNSATLVLDKQITSTGIQAGTAQVDLILQVDAKALRTLLESNFNYSSLAATEGKFRIYVLSYTLEGMDPNRAQPQVLHEEVVDDQKGVHSSSFANSASNADAQSSGASLAASAASSNKGNVSANSSASAEYKAKMALAADSTAGNMGGGQADFANQSVSGSAAASGKVTSSASASGNWDVNQSASVDARKHQSSSSSSKSANSGSSFDDTSHYYCRVVDYADPTKKGTALSDEVHDEVEGMMTNAGFDVATLNVSMMSKSFPTEDDLVDEVLNEMRGNPSVSPNDYVAIALNSFTPVSVETHQFTSKVTYRVVRIKDGLALLPAQDITGDSGDRAPSDDVARTYAVKSAMLKVDDILPAEITQALQKMQRADQREAAASAAFYVIVVDNAATLTASTPIRSALAAAGYEVERSINGLAKTQTLTVKLNGKTGENVMDAIENALGTYTVETMDGQGARVSAK